MNSQPNPAVEGTVTEATEKTMRVLTYDLTDNERGNMDRGIEVTFDLSETFPAIVLEEPGPAIGLESREDEEGIHWVAFLWNRDGEVQRIFRLRDGFWIV